MIKIFFFSQFLECITNFERTTSYISINIVHMNNDMNNIYEYIISIS